MSDDLRPRHRQPVIRPRRPDKRILPWLAAGLLLLVSAPLGADWVGSLVNRIFIDPVSIPVIADGWDNGDEVSFILETTPADTGSDLGHAAWMSVYIPPGAEVIGAEFVLPASNGGYDPIPAEDTDDTYDGWGSRGDPGYGPKTGGTQLAPGYVNEVQQDTGIFYSTDVRTRLVVDGVDDDCDGSPDLLDPTGGPSAQVIYNRFDWDHTLGFGIGAATSGNAGKGNTPVRGTGCTGDDGLGCTWTGVGSIVSGPDTYYTNAYDPGFDDCSDGPGGAFVAGCDGDGLADDFLAETACVGPFQRIAYPNSKLGGSDSPEKCAPGDTCPPFEADPTILQPAYEQGDIRLTALPTAAGWDFADTDLILCGDSDPATPCPLPAATNMVRFVHGARRLGELENARITLRITDATAFTQSVFVDDGASEPTDDETFCLDSTGGDTSDTAAKDNPFRYYEPQHECSFLAGKGNLTKQTKFVNNLPSSGASLSVGDIVSYQITFTNTSGSDLTLVDLYDRAEDLFGAPTANLDLIEPGDPLCAWSSYDGDLPGMTPAYQAGSATAGEARWGQIATFSAGVQVNVFLCTEVTGGAINERLDNSALVDYNFSPLPADRVVGLRSTSGGTITTSISGTVYVDADGSGDFTPGEAGAVGVTVSLYVDSNGNGVLDFGEPLVGTRLTLSDGSYIFAGIPGGDYIVVETDPPGWISTGDKDNLRGPCGVGNGCNTIGVTVAAGGESTLNDFFDVPPAGATNLISGTTFVDRDEDQSFDPGEGEVGQGGILVRLYRDEDGDGILDDGEPELQTQVSDVLGQYVFILTEDPDDPLVCTGTPGDCHYTVVIDETTLPPGASLTGTPPPPKNLETAMFGMLGDPPDTGNDFGFFGGAGTTGGVCFAVADSVDELVAYTVATMTFTDIGPTGTSSIEAIAFDPGTATLCGANGDRMGTIDLGTGAFTQLPSAFGSCKLAGGVTVTVNDVDGLTFDPFTGLLWGSVRRSSVNDVLLVIDPATGKVAPDGVDPFGPGVTCVEIDTSALGVTDIDDVAIDPTARAPSGGPLMFATANQDPGGGGSNDRLVVIDTTDGSVIDIDRITLGGLGLDDVEGLGFDNDGVLYATTGNQAAGTNDKLYSLNKSTAVATQVADLFRTGPPSLEDYESVDCLTAGANLVTGTVFADGDGSGALDPGEVGQAGVTVSLYLDVDGDDMVDPGVDELLQTVVTGASGAYSFSLGAEGDFVLETDLSAGYPQGAVLTTDNVEEADFVGFNQTEAGNDFGFALPNVLQITKLSSAAGGYVAQGDVITYTLIPRISGPQLLTNVEVEDFIPVGTTLVAGSAVPTQSEGPDPLEWEFGDHELGIQGVIETTLCPAQASLTAAADTYLRKDSPEFDRNFGGRDVMETRPAGTDIRQGLVRFNLSSIPSNATVTDAVLGVTSRNNQGDHLVQVRESTTAWTEGSLNNDPCGQSGPPGATWNAPNCTDTGTGWDGLGGDYSTDPFGATVYGTLVPNSTVQSVSVTTLVAAWVAGTTPNNGFALYATGISTGNAQWGVKEGGDPATLVVDYLVPTPGGCTELTTLIATQDNWLREDATGTNNGSDSQLRTRPNPPNQDNHAILQFDLASIPPGATINLATFGIWEETTRDATQTITLYRLTESWTEGASTWLSRDGVLDWSTPGGTFDSTPLGSFNPTSTGFRTFDLTTLAQSWLDGALPNNGLILVATTTSQSGDVRYTSKEGTADQRPYLEVDWTLAADLTTNDITAVGTLVSHGDAVTVTMTLTSAEDDTNVTPGPLTVNGVDGASAVCGAPSPASRGITAGPPITFEWTCTASAAVGELLGRLTFEAEAAGDNLSFANAVSHTVMVTRPLVFSVQVDNPLAANQTTIVNTAIADSDQTFPDSTDTTVDVVAKGVLGDQVWLDTDGDGVQDIGEEGIPNVEVTLYDAGGDGMPGGGDDVAVATTTTGADGRYLFTDLPPGTYFVEVTDGTLPAGLTEAPGTTDPSATRTITGSEVFQDLDFGYVPDPGKAVIGNYVWSDADDDGRQDPGEPGIGGVTLDLIDAKTKAVVATTTTAADGSYLFSGLDPGRYRVEVTDTGGVLAGYSLTIGPQSKKNPTETIVVAADEVYEKADFGYFKTGLGTIGSQVWLDEDNDGFFDSGSEPGLAGVSVDLVADLNGDGVWDPDGPDDVPGNGDDERVIATARTAADGTYSFTGLSLDDGGGDGDADYLVVVSDVDGVVAAMIQTFGTAGLDGHGQTDPYPVELSAASPTDDTADFGFEPPNVLGDRVWSDANSDGVQDPAEPGIGGVVLNLLDGLGNPVLDAADMPIFETTAPDGSYLFGGVDPGDYIVEVDSSNFAPGGALEGYVQTGDPDEGGLCAVCDGESAFTMLLAISDLMRDFGYRAPGAVYPISGTVFTDTDEDGFDDGLPGETGIAGVTVELRDTAGSLIATTTTDASGDYQFPDLPDGDYTVVVTDAAGVLDGYTLTSGLDAIDVSVSSGPVTDIDFGYARNPVNASIGNTLWFDADGDGLQGPAEPGIPGVAVDLYEDVDGDDVLEPTVELFSGRIDLDGDGDVDGFDDGVLAGIRIIDGRLDLDGSGDIDGLDAGTFNGATVIAGEIDLNGSGGVDGFDTGTLAGDDGLPMATTLTDGNGQFIFPGLPPGSYFVDVREGTVPDSTADGIPDLLETGYPVGVDPSAVILLSEGERYEDADFGYLPRPGTAAFGDRVWNDADGDGEQDDGELGIAGVDIIVSGPSGDTTLTTGADGFWMITGLTASSTLYSVNFDVGTVPVGLTRTFPGDVSYQVTVNGGDLFSHLDYGFTGGSYGQIGSLTWLDLNGDGDVDGGEPPIEGVTVSLIDDANGDGIWDPDGADKVFGTADDEPILETATTDPAGAYLFTGVPLSADYLVDVSDIGGVLADLQKTSGAADTDNNSQDDPYDVSMPGVPTAILTADFGYTPAGGFGSIGNKVWHDLDGDGVRDAGEPGVQGVTVQLWVDVDGNGALTPGVDNLVRTSVTDTSGEYEFQSLPVGDYLVVLPGEGCSACVLAGLVKTSGSLGVDDNSQPNPYPVTLSSGAADNVTADFGFRADPGGSVLTVGGTVFEDVVTDAVFDDGVEPEVAGATVFLFRDLDGDGVLDATDPLIGTATTDVNGDFLFTDLPPGDYLLAVSVDGTSVDDFLQTTQAGSGGVQAVSLPTTDPPDPGAPSSTGNDFGFWNGGTVTNPITLAWFRAEEAGAGVRFEWMTATETGNVGFNLYAVGETGLRRLNEELIPSAVIDSLEPQRYELEAWGVDEQLFMLEDIDLLGLRRYHGPFERGAERGAEPETERIPWGEIRVAHTLRRAGRRAALAQGEAAMAGGPGSRRIGPSRQGWGAARLEVSTDGIYRVSYEQLRAAGVNLTGAPLEALALTVRGKPVPIRVEGAGLLGHRYSAGRFGPGAYVEFVGQALDTLYTRVNVYTLEVARRRALRVEREDQPAAPWAATPSAYAERLGVDRDRKYILTAPGEDPWYEAHLLAYGGPAGGEFEVEVDAYAGGTATLEVELWGLSEFPRLPDHHVELQWNGASVAEEWFDGRVVQRIAAELPFGSLTEGTNVLGLTLPGDGGTPWDMVAFDRLWVTYPRRFEPRDGRLRFAAAAEAFEVGGLGASDAVVYRLTGDSPVLVGGLSYVADGGGTRVRFAGSSDEAVYHVASAASLLVPQISPVAERTRLPGRSRLLVISHADFLDEIQPLVDARRSEGWSVNVIDVEEVYARRSHGVVDPQALRKFIRWAHAKRRTEAVLLVGGDTYDYHDNLGLGSISFVPSLYAATDAVVRFAPVDPLYGDVDDDGVPDVSVGRLPVRTPAELASVVSRILEYGDSPHIGTALLSADAYDVAGGYSFGVASDQMAAMLPAGWTTERVYLDELGLAEARSRLIDGINEGVGLTSYFGHSGPTAWSFDNLFRASDAAALENSGRPTVVTQWGCWNNYHVTPSYNTVGHKLLLSGDRGAAAVLGAATLTNARSEQKLGRLLFARLGRPGATLGGALLEAKRELAETDPDLVDVILGWTLLGDPTLRVDH